MYCTERSLHFAKLCLFQIAVYLQIGNQPMIKLNIMIVFGAQYYSLNDDCTPADDCSGNYSGWLRLSSCFSAFYPKGQIKRTRSRQISSFRHAHLRRRSETAELQRWLSCGSASTARVLVHPPLMMLTTLSRVQTNLRVKLEWFSNMQCCWTVTNHYSIIHFFY